MSFDLHRFVAAQRDSWDVALAELQAGAKRSHWMWFIFPQIAGLGRSDTARYYAIPSLDDARLYLTHPVLGPRLVEAASALLAHRGRRVEDMLGTVDAAKLRSSMTLFEAAGGPPVLGDVLDAFYAGARDGETNRLIGA